jgi:hypothetical protein
MNKTTLVCMLSAGLALLPVVGAFSAAPNPTPTRQSKLLVDFESDVAATSDPDGSGQNRASVNTTAEFVAEGTKSLKLDFTDFGSWNANYLVIDLAQPIDIKGHQMLAMDVYVPAESLNPDSTEGAWWQLTPHITTTNADDESQTTETWLAMRQMVAGWNHLVWDLKTGIDTKITRIAFAGNTNGARPYTGPIYVDNIRVYEGTFAGIKPDEKLIQGFEDPAVKDAFSGAQTVEINTDKQFVRDGNSSLKVDLTGAEGGWTSDVVRADDWGTTLDVSNATAIHLDVFVPEESRPALEGWSELGFVVIGEGGEVWGSSVGFLPGQWNTLVLNLTPEQAAMLTNVTGMFFMRNQGANSGDPNPWQGPIYVDNLRAVVPTQEQPTAGE